MPKTGILILSDENLDYSNIRFLENGKERYTFKIPRPAGMYVDSDHNVYTHVCGQNSNM